MSKKGFTLVELMVVVTIVGILATIAIVGFTKFIEQGRESEAMALLSQISAKEENYRAQRGSYLSAPANPVGTTPTEGEKRAWDQTQANWKRLGAKPGKSHVYYQYQVVAGNNTDCTAQPACSGVTGKTWWYAIASNNKKNIYINSARRQPWVKKIRQQ